jgi:hypothetical protein
MPKKRTTSKLAKGPWWVPVLTTGIGIAVKTAGAVLDHWLNPDDGRRSSTGSGGTGTNRKKRSAAPKKAVARARSKWWKILGVSENATAAEIKKAFREQMILTHPDKVAHLSKTLQKAAEREAKKLNQAYAEALNSRGGT